MRVLIVDDQPDIADMLQMLLQCARHSVRVAYRGVEAIEVARTFVPELALVDIQLPDISGESPSQPLAYTSSSMLLAKRQSLRSATRLA